MSAALLRRAIPSDRFPGPGASDGQGVPVGDTLLITASEG